MDAVGSITYFKSVLAFTVTLNEIEITDLLYDLKMLFYSLVTC